MYMIIWLWLIVYILVDDAHIPTPRRTPGSGCGICSNICKHWRQRRARARALRLVLKLTMSGGNGHICNKCRHQCLRIGMAGWGWRVFPIIHQKRLHDPRMIRYKGHAWSRVTYFVCRKWKTQSTLVQHTISKIWLVVFNPLANLWKSEYSRCGPADHHPQTRET